MTFFFLRLFKVKIFPNVAVHTKNATLEGALFLQMLFKEMKLSGAAKHMIKRFDFKCPPFGRIQQILSPGHLLST
jgi:hypothetical protein